MSIIDNFNELSTEELQAFATEIVNKINTDHVFSTDVTFKIDSVEPDDLSGDLMIGLSHEKPIVISREATWQCGDTDEVEDIPDFPHFDESIYTDVKPYFKTTKIELDGYQILLEIDDADASNILEVTADKYSHEDAGIGFYQFGDGTYYDSQPYIEVEGTVTQNCFVYPTLYVEPLTN